MSVGIDKRSYSVEVKDLKMSHIVMSVATQMDRTVRAGGDPNWVYFKQSLAWAQIKKTIPAETQIVFEAEWRKMYEALFLPDERM